MSKFTKEMVDSYADKLLIGLTEEENNLVLNEFEIIDENMELITKIKDIEKVTPMTHTLDDFTYELREDEYVESINIDDALSNSDSTEGRQIKVPNVVEVTK